MYSLALRFGTIAAVFGVVGASVAIGNAVGMPVSQSIPLGLLLAGVTLLSLHSALGDGESDSPAAIVAFVMLLFATLGGMIEGKRIWPDTNAFLLFVGAVVVEFVAFIVLGGLVTAAAKRVARSRRTGRRRKLAAARGWRFEATDADLPSALGGVEQSVRHVAGRHVAASRPVPDGARAYNIVRGEARGVEVVAFDFYAERPLERPQITTAWIAHLPHALPLFTSFEIFRASSDAGDDATLDDMMNEFFGTTGGDDADTASRGAERRDDSVITTNPGYARAVMTDDVVAFTREHLASWWVNGRVVASTAPEGAAPNLLERNIEAIAWLATVLSSRQVVQYALASDRPDPALPPAT